MNYYPFHIGDYAAHTRHLTLLEDLAYRRLLDAAYLREGPLPEDVQVVARLIGMRDNATEVEAVLGEFFVRSEAGWLNHRADLEIAAYSAKIEQASRAGRASAERRRNRGSAPAEQASNNGSTTVEQALIGRSTNQNQNQNQERSREQPAAQAPVPRPDERPALAVVQTPRGPENAAGPRPGAATEPAMLARAAPPACPHLEILALWGEVLPQLPQHLPSQWKGAREEHLRARWREAAVENGWKTQAQGLAYFRTLFVFVGRSRFLSGRSRPSDPTKRPFIVELAWLVSPENWAKTVEGKYHEESA